MRGMRGMLGMLGVLVSCAKEPGLPAVVPVPADDVAAYTAPVPSAPPPVVQVPAPPAPRPVAHNEVRYDWVEGQVYQVRVMQGYPATVRLQPGEHIASVVDSDREYLHAPAEDAEQPQNGQTPGRKPDDACWYGARFQFCRGISEQRYTPVQHLVITATHADGRLGHSKQGMVIFTDMRMYVLEVLAVRKTTDWMYGWNYPAPPPEPPKPREPGLFPDTGVPRTYHIGYTFTDREGIKLAPGERYDWSPVRVWSDIPGIHAAKIYLEFPQTVLHQRMPLLRGMDDAGKPYLLNSRQYGRFVVVDELAPRLELRRGAKSDAQVVVITREQLTPLQCPGDPQCPHFPH